MSDASSALTPAQQARDWLRKVINPGIPALANVETDDRLREFLERQIVIEQENLRKSNDWHCKNAVAAYAAGLLSFGRLDMADVILNNLPKGTYTQGLVRGIMTSVLPTPGGFESQLSFARIRDWLAVNSSNLRWDPNKGRFVLVDEATGGE